MIYLKARLFQLVSEPFNSKTYKYKGNQMKVEFIELWALIITLMKAQKRHFIELLVLQTD